VCIGRNMATLIIFKFVAQLLTRYDVRLVEAEKPPAIRSLWIAVFGETMVELHIRK
jgi:hypothetical protein